MVAPPHILHNRLPHPQTTSPDNCQRGHVSTESDVFRDLSVGFACSNGTAPSPPPQPRSQQASPKAFQAQQHPRQHPLQPPCTDTSTNGLRPGLWRRSPLPLPLLPAASFTTTSPAAASTDFSAEAMTTAAVPWLRLKRQPTLPLSAAALFVAVRHAVIHAASSMEEASPRPSRGLVRSCGTRPPLPRRGHVRDEFAHGRPRGARSGPRRPSPRGSLADFFAAAFPHSPLAPPAGSSSRRARALRPRRQPAAVSPMRWAPSRPRLRRRGVPALPRRTLVRGGGVPAAPIHGGISGVVHSSCPRATVARPRVTGATAVPPNPREKTTSTKKAQLHLKEQKAGGLGDVP